ncbi:hypothetical protein [Catellatospora sp. NPDC049133]|uniref:hypothetical protein n=1 Tax=Catellatospora sp. NPDC049133 TaxID=3155499 RepID=UPI0034081912
MGFTACAFCDATGETTKITKEHLYSEWINLVLPASVVGPNITVEWTDHVSGAFRTRPVRELASEQVRCVCHRCNNGWMSKLDDQVRPLLEPMILGKPTTLSALDQLTVATWAAMKAAVFEFAWDNPPVYEQADREIIRTQQRPPATVRVALAAIQSQGFPLRAISRGIVGGGRAAQCLTLQIGCLVMQILGGPLAGAHGFHTVGGVRPRHVMVYPPALSGQRWPPTEVHDDASLLASTEPWGGPGGQVSGPRV